MNKTVHLFGLPETGPSRRAPLAPRQRACHIVCADCGNAADVTLDVLLEVLPASELHLRCLDCLGEQVTVTETTRVAH